MTFPRILNKVLIITGLTLMTATVSVNVSAKDKSAQGKSSRSTPASENVCAPLKGSKGGLYGLCTAFCKAQDGSATYDPSTNTLTFDENFKPSSRKLLEKYNERAKAVGGPPMPCVNVVQNECPCWTSEQLSQVADGDPANSCRSVLDFNASIFGTDGATGSLDIAMAQSTPFAGNSCRYLENSPRSGMYLMGLDDESFSSCVRSIKRVCADRDS